MTHYLSYSFNTKTKRKEYLYQNRVESFKLIAAKILSFKSYCEGKIAMYNGNEFSPYFDEAGSSLAFRTKIAKSSELNELFLTAKSRAAVNKLLEIISLVCNAELQSSSGSKEVNSNIYDLTLAECESCLRTLFDELNLK